MIGASLLETLLYISMTAELVPLIGIGVTLLFFHHHQSFSVLFHSSGTGHGLNWLTTPFLTTVAFVGFSFLGFESAGSIAEEVQESRRVLPKAILLRWPPPDAWLSSATLGIILAIPSVPGGHGTAPSPIPSPCCRMRWATASDGCCRPCSRSASRRA